MPLKFEYLPRLGPKGYEFEPVLDVVFTNPANGSFVEARCLVDSGSSDIILNVQFAKKLGLQLLKGEPHDFRGIGDGDPVTGYDHPLTIRLKVDTNEYSIRCAFLPLPIAGQLGQRGFSENYKVVFEQYKKRFQLTPQAKLSEPLPPPAVVS